VRAEAQSGSHWRKAKGRSIHPGFQAAAAGALAIAMIQTPFEALLVAAVGFAALQAARFFAAARSAITLATITMSAEIKHRAAGRKVTSR
jgi:hypothetical protein